jgi:hypothetical protein
MPLRPTSHFFKPPPDVPHVRDSSHNLLHANLSRAFVVLRDPPPIDGLAERLAEWREEGDDARAAVAGGLLEDVLGPLFNLEEQRRADERLLVEFAADFAFRAALGVVTVFYPPPLVRAISNPPPSSTTSAPTPAPSLGPTPRGPLMTVRPNFL